MRTLEVEPASLLDALTLLHSRNFAQWRLEAAIRQATLADADVARIKRDIDASNSARTYLIDWIDIAVGRAFGFTNAQTWRGKHVNSDTIGQLLDKVSVLSLKIYFTKVATSRRDLSVTERGDCSDRIPKLQWHRDYVLECYDRFLQSLRNGSACMPITGQMKYYDSTDLAAVSNTAIGDSECVLPTP